MVVCHHCCAKVTVVDICNNETDFDYGLEDFGGDDNETEQIEQMADELAGYIGDADTLEQRRAQQQTNKELIGIGNPKSAKEDRV